MSNHIYTRTLGDNGYNINNKERNTHIAKEIETALPGKMFKTIANGTELLVSFEEELTAEESTTLAQVVDDHKNNA